MLMHDRPALVDFAKANGQAKIKLNFISVCLSSGTAQRQRDIISSSYV